MKDDKKIVIDARTGYTAAGPQTEVRILASAEGLPADTLAVASSGNGAPAKAVAESAIGILDARASEARRQLEGMGLIDKKTASPVLDAVDPKTFEAEQQAMRQVGEVLELKPSHRPSDVLAALRSLGSIITRATTRGVERGSPDHVALQRVQRAAGSLPLVTGVSSIVMSSTTPGVSHLSHGMVIAPSKHSTRPIDRAYKPSFIGIRWELKQLVTIGEMNDVGVPSPGLAVARELSDFGKTAAADTPFVMGVDDARALANALFYAGQELALYKRPHESDARSLLAANRMIREQREELVRLRESCVAFEREIREARIACKTLREERDALKAAPHYQEKIDLAKKFNTQTEELAKIRAQLAEQERSSTAKTRQLSAMAAALVPPDAAGGALGVTQHTSIQPHPSRDQYAQRVTVYERVDANGHRLRTRMEMDVPPAGTKVTNTGTEAAPKMEVVPIEAPKPKRSLRIYGAYHWQIPSTAKNTKRDDNGTWSYDVEEDAPAVPNPPTTPTLQGTTVKSDPKSEYQRRDTYQPLIFKTDAPCIDPFWQRRRY